MARDIGANEGITFGADASIADFSSISVAFWLDRDATGGMHLVSKTPNPIAAGWDIIVQGPGNNHRLRFRRFYSGGTASWRSTSEVQTELRHIAITHDGSSGSNDPVMYIDGVPETLVSTVTASGSLLSEASDVLRIGEDATGANDFDGAIQDPTYANAIWTADQVNQHRWWGRVGGTVAVHHPLMTDKLVNEGTATADGSATGTSVRALPRVLRPGGGGW